MKIVFAMNSHTERHGPEKFPYIISNLFFMRIYSGFFFAFFPVFYLDLNIILVIPHKQKYIYITLEWFVMKNYTGKNTFIRFLTILVVFHFDMNLFFVMNSHSRRKLTIYMTYWIQLMGPHWCYSNQKHEMKSLQPFRLPGTHCLI